MIVGATSWPDPVWEKIEDVLARCWPGVAGGKYYLINTLPLWKEFFKLLIEQPLVACDTETTSLSFIDGKIIGFSFSWGAAHSYYVPVRHATTCKQLNIEDIRADLIQFFSDTGITTVWSNFKFDGHFLLDEGMCPRGVVHDTRLIGSLIDENAPGALKKQAVTHIDKAADKWETMIDLYRGTYGRQNKIPKRNVHYGYIPVTLMTPYAASDAHYSWAIFKKFISRMMLDPQLVELYIMESQLMWVLLDIEHYGVFVDREYLEGVGPELEQEAAALHHDIKQKLGDVNPDSNKTLIPALQKIGVKLFKKTKTGATYSLDAQVMEYLATKYDVCQDILSYRQTKKKKSTYVDSILEKLDDQMRLHCEYNQILVTGRMSSKKPNLQNIPGRDLTIRKGFIAPKWVKCIDHCGYTGKHLIIPATCPKCGGRLVDLDKFILAYIDYSQMEIRMTGHYSQDKILLNVYNVSNENVHLRTMCEIFGWDYKESKEAKDDEKHPRHSEAKAQYKIAKMINFLIIYGGSAKTLSARISTPAKQYSEKQCKIFMRSYFKKYKGVRKWISNEKQFIRKNGEGQNHFNRYRRFPDLAKMLPKEHLRDYRWRIERIERQWVNYLIQGSCADLFKIAMIRVHNILKETETKMVMPIHDELAFYLHVDEFEIMRQVKDAMEDFKFRVPMTVDISWSDTNWAEKKELDLAS